MNNARRKQIAELISKVNTLQEEIQQVLDDENDYFENVPENLQNSEKYQSSETSISNLEDARDNLEAVEESLTQAADPS
jgi:DNA repair exonuclease SbcCD ATPase subunit